MTDIQTAKAKVRALWDAVDAASASDMQSVATQHLAADFQWQGFAPFTETRGPGAYASHYLAPFRTAFPAYTRQTHIFCAGYSNGRHEGGEDGALWVGATGYLVGQAVAEFLEIPVTDKALRLRWAEFYRIENGQIVQCQHQIDLVDWFEQIGRPVLPPPTGVAHVWPAPTGYDGMLADEHDPDEAVKSLALGRDLVFGGLNKFDQSDLSSMGMARFFHPNIKWYGPGGIGACLSLDEFTTLHQEPWLIAFPDRAVQDLTNLFAEDRMVASSGWAGVIGHHMGPYQNHAGTGNEIRVNGIDFWLREGDVFTENWVYVDFVHLFAQMGVDLMARMKEA